MELLEQIKKSQRITHDKLDDILLSDIDAAAFELYRTGINPFELDADTGEILKDADGKNILSDRPLITKAIELYSKAQQDFEEKGNVYMLSFEKLRDSMALSGEYRCTTKSLL